MPASYFLQIVSGEDLERTVTWTNSDGTLVNLTGYHAEMVINDQASGALLIDFTDQGVVTSNDPLITDPSGMTMTLGGSSGQITFKVIAADLGPSSRLMDYRLFVIDPQGNKRALLFGQISLMGLS